MSDKDYHSLTAEEKNELIRNSITLMRTLTNIWGADAGILLWEKISEALGNDVKGEIFFGLITGKYMPNVVIVNTVCSDIVSMIKAIRTSTGHGLKESKDICDTIRQVGPQKIECEDAKIAANLARELIYLGCKVIY